MPRGIELEDRVIHHRVDQAPEAPFAFEQAAMRLLAIGHVARDLGEADQLTGFVAYRIDHRQSPESASVLAEPPTLRFEPPDLRCCLQSVLWETTLAVFRGEEGLEGTSDDFPGLVTLQAPRSGIPGRYNPIETDHVNGVINDAIDHELQAARVLHVVYFCGNHPSPYTPVGVAGKRRKPAEYWNAHTGLGFRGGILPPDQHVEAEPPLSHDKQQDRLGHQRGRGGGRRAGEAVTRDQHEA